MSQNALIFIQKRVEYFLSSNGRYKVIDSGGDVSVCPHTKTHAGGELFQRKDSLKHQDRRMSHFKKGVNYVSP